MWQLSIPFPLTLNKTTIFCWFIVQDKEGKLSTFVEKDISDTKQRIILMRQISSLFYFWLEKNTNVYLTDALFLDIFSQGWF